MLLRWIYTQYGQRTRLYYRERILWSARGGRQGDNLFTDLYCLTLNRAVLSLKGAPGLLFQGWYADGALLVVRRDEAVGLLTLLKRRLLELDQDLGWDKCLINRELDLTQETIAALGGQPRVMQNGTDVLKVMGVPVLGSPAAIRLWFEQKLVKIKELTEKIVELDDVHRGFALLRSTAAYCKVVHFIRSLPLDAFDGIYSNFLQAFDSLVLDSFCEVAHIGVTERSRQQLVLPIRLGGFGLRRAHRHANAAFIAGSLNSAPLVTAVLRANGVLGAEGSWEDPGLDEAIHRFNEADDLDQLLTRERLNAGTEQAELSLIIDECDHAAYLSQASTADRVRMNSLQMPHALDVLTVRPDPAQSLWLTNSEASAYFGFLLGRGPAPGAPCNRCGHVLDPEGTHASTCSKGRWRKKRHDDACAVVAEFSRLGDFSVTEDRPVAYVAGDSNPKRPDLAVLAFGPSGRSNAFDLAVTSPQQSKTRDRAAAEKGYAAKVKERQKHRKYDELCVSRGFGFTPLAAETYGGWGAEAVAAFKIIITKVADEIQHRTRGAVARRFYGKLAVSLARNTAWALLESRPARPDPPLIDARDH